MFSVLTRLITRTSTLKNFIFLQWLRTRNKERYQFPVAFCSGTVLLSARDRPRGRCVQPIASPLTFPVLNIMSPWIHLCSSHIWVHLKVMLCTEHIFLWMNPVITSLFFPIYNIVLPGINFSLRYIRARSYMTVIVLLRNLTYIKNYKNSVI